MTTHPPHVLGTSPLPRPPAAVRAPAPEGDTTNVPKRVLVTGAAGQIGSIVTEYLRSHRIHVTGLSLHGPPPPGADRFVVGDATSPATVKAALVDADAVVHLAAIPHPTLGPAYDVYRTNVCATFNVLDAASESGLKRAVVASSINASGLPLNRTGIMPAYFPLDEDLPTDVSDPYSLSKFSDEWTCRMMARRSGMAVVALRFPLVGSLTTLRATALDCEARPERDVREGWSYLDRRDAAAAVFLSLTANLDGAHVIGLSASDTLIRRPTMELLAEFAPYVPVRAPIAGYGPAVSSVRARHLLGFEARYSVHHPPFDGEAVAVGQGQAGKPQVDGS